VALKSPRINGDPENGGRDGLANRLHAVQVRTQVVGMGGRIEIVVRPSEPRVQRASAFGLLAYMPA